MVIARGKKSENGTVYCHKKREKDKTLHVDREPFWLPLSQHVKIMKRTEFISFPGARSTVTISEPVTYKMIVYDP